MTVLKNMIGTPTLRQHILSYLCVGTLAVSLTAVVTVAGEGGTSSSSPLSSSRDENFFKRVAFTSQPNGYKRRTGPSLPLSRVLPMNEETSG